MSVDDALIRRGLRLEYATLGWNVVGTALLAGAAIDAGSVALAGFGLDSLIEIAASTVVVWQLNGVALGREETAMRALAACFASLSAFVLVLSIYTVVNGIRATPSPIGLAWLAATVLTMLALAWGKLVTGRRLANQTLLTEARVTLVDAYLAAAVLLGVGLNATLGWWWADPASGVVVVLYAGKEALEARAKSKSL